MLMKQHLTRLGPSSSACDVSLSRVLSLEFSSSAENDGIMAKSSAPLPVAADDNPASNFAHGDDEDDDELSVASSSSSEASSEESDSASVHCCRNREEDDDDDDDDDGDVSRTNTAELSWAGDSSHHNEHREGGARGLVTIPAARRASNESCVSAVSAVSSNGPSSSLRGGGRGRRRSSMGFDLPTGLERRDSLQRQYSDLQSSHSDLLADRLRLERENESHRKAAAKLERERNVFRAQASEWRSVVQDATRNLGTVSERSRRFEVEAAQLRAELARVQAEKSSVESENSRLREERDRARAASRRLRKERNFLRKTLEAATASSSKAAAAPPAQGEQVYHRSSSKSFALSQDISDSALPASSWAEDVEAVRNDSISSFSWMRRLSLGGGVAGEASSTSSTMLTFEETKRTAAGESAHDMPVSSKGRTATEQQESSSQLQENSADNDARNDEQEAGAPVRGMGRGLLGSFRRRSLVGGNGGGDGNTATESSSSVQARDGTSSIKVWTFGRRRRSIDLSAAGIDAAVNRDSRSGWQGTKPEDGAKLQKLICDEEDGRRSLESSASTLRRESLPIAECA